MPSTVIPVTRPFLPPFEEYVDELRELWETHILTNQGPKYLELEKLIQRFLENDNVALFANGHLALQIAFRGLGLTEGEVITTPYTFASTTHAIVECGLTPVFCDIDERTMTIDPEKIEALVTDRTKAICGVHVYGMPCDFERIEALSRRHSLRVVYDAAHAFGERYAGESIASWGDISMFSFHATKAFHSVEGGCLSFSDGAVCEAACKIRQFGIIGDEPVGFVGTNAKMTEVHAAMGLCNLRHFKEIVTSRQKAFERYQERFEGVRGLRTLSYPEKLEPNYSYFPIILENGFGANRDALVDFLKRDGILARKYFYPLTSSFPCYARRFGSPSTPIANRISQNVLCLPLYAGISLHEVDMISNAVLSHRS